MQCERCGLPLNNPGPSCPGCGAALSESRTTGEERDYYALFELSPHMSYAEIRARLGQAARVWGHRANNAARLEQRHQAERMLQCLSEAEAVLLNAPTRSTYDARWRDRQGSSRYSARAADQSFAGESASQTSPRYDPSDARGGPRVEPHWEPPSVVPAPVAPGRSSHVPTGEGDPGAHSNWFGWITLRGTVIHLDTLYTIPPPTSWIRILLALIVFPVVVPFVLAFWLATRILFPRSGRPLDITNLLLLCFTLSRTGPRSQVPVRDLRLRDSSGNEHSVRMMGHLVAGGVNVGDDVTLSGFSRGGTLKVRQGINHRTRSAIRVRT
jgi:hypothetical protein